MKILLLRAKILGVFIPSYIITLLSFIAFGIIVNIGGFMYFGRLIFPNIKWLIIIFLIAPAINLLSNNDDYRKQEYIGNNEEIVK